MSAPRRAYLDEILARKRVEVARRVRRQETLSRLAADAALRDRLGRAGRERVAQAYCLDVVAPQMLALLRRVAARGQGVTS